MSLAAVLAWVFGIALIQTQVENYKLKNPSDTITNQTSLNNVCRYEMYRNTGCMVAHVCYRYNKVGGWWYATKDKPECCGIEGRNYYGCEKEKTK